MRRHVLGLEVRILAKHLTLNTAMIQSPFQGLWASCPLTAFQFADCISIVSLRNGNSFAVLTCKFSILTLRIVIIYDLFSMQNEVRFMQFYPFALVLENKY